MSDYSKLAQRVSASASGIRGCLLLSRDGLVLGAHPEGEPERALKAAWVRFASIGEPDRSYVEFPDQTWAYVRRGAYAAFAAADLGVRPGVLVDLLEQALMTGELERVADRETMRLPEAPAAPSGKPRTSLHKADRAAAAPEAAIAEVTPSSSEETGGSRAGDAHAGGADGAEGSGADRPTDEDAAPEPAPVTGPAAPPAVDDEATEVDRILLAKEFAGLLQVPKEDDEASR